MVVIETCPKCNGDLDILILTTNPPIPARRCRRCGWYWQGEMEMPVRIPFGKSRNNYSFEAEANSNG